MIGLACMTYTVLAVVHVVCICGGSEVAHG